MLLQLPSPASATSVQGFGKTRPRPLFPGQAAQVLGGSLPQLPLQPEPSQVNNQLPSPQSGREQRLQSFIVTDLTTQELLPCFLIRGQVLFLFSLWNTSPPPTHTPKGPTTQLACKTDWTVTVSQQTSGGIRQEAPSIPEWGQTWMTDTFYRWRRQWPE